MSNPVSTRRRRFSVLLFGSLCINLALGGYIASQWFYPQEFRPFAALQGGRLLFSVARRLPADDARILIEAYRRRGPQIETARADFDAAVAKVVDLLIKPNIDLATLRPAIDEARAKRGRQNDLLVDAFLDAVTGMSPEGRRDLTKRFRDGRDTKNSGT